MAGELPQWLSYTISNPAGIYKIRRREGYEGAGPKIGGNTALFCSDKAKVCSDKIQVGQC